MKNSLIEKLNAAKRNKGVTLKQLAEMSGISPGTVNKIMSGALLDVKTEKLQKLADALGVSMHYLTAEQDAPQERILNYGIAKVACISPDVRVADCDYNAERIIEGAIRAAADGASVIVFPELCITGYCCGDLFFQQALRRSAERNLEEICRATEKIHAVIAVGLPVTDGAGRLYNAAALLFGGDILGVVPKTNLPNYNEFYEKRHFAAAPQNTGVIRLCGKDRVFGTNVIFANSGMPEMAIAVEICEDIWVSDTPSSRHAKAGATLILNLSASNETLCKAEYRRKIVEVQSAKACAVYAYCSSGMGESTADTVFSAHNVICENGAVLAESKPFGKGYAAAEADFGFIRNERSKMLREDADRYVTVSFDMPVNRAPQRVYDASPFVPADKKQLAERCETAFMLQAYGIKKRLQHTGAKKLVLGVSGGSDSTLALIACRRALELASRPASDIVAVTMPCFGTTERTLENSLALAKAYGAQTVKVDISASVTQHLKDIGHDLAPDVVFENAQARERTQVLMDIANGCNGLVIGTGDMSELALGWSTYNGDHMSMYCVNGGVPKTLVRAMIGYEAEKNSATRDILRDVLDTPVSPELLPPEQGQIAQQTEKVVGPYRLHDYFLYMTVRKGFAPDKVYALAKLSFAGEFTPQEILHWLKLFVKRFFSQQFKRSCQPDGIKIGTTDISKNNWRMPSDVCGDVWQSLLEKLQ